MYNKRTGIIKHKKHFLLSLMITDIMTQQILGWGEEINVNFNTVQLFLLLTTPLCLYLWHSISIRLKINLINKVRKSTFNV